MAAYFVTATGTDIGKTFVVAGLVRHFRRAGVPVHAIKPVVSGFNPDDILGSDPDHLLAALGLPRTADEVARIAPWRFGAPLSPDLAARKEGRRLEFEDIVAFCCQSIADSAGFLFIEGVGGVMVPLDTRRTVLDWMAAINVPALIVAGSYLGTISHTLTALDVTIRRGIPVAAVVVSESDASTVPLNDTVSAIQNFAGNVQVIGLRRLGKPDDRAFSAIADHLMAQEEQR